MITIFYRNYPYSPLASVFSALSMLFGVLFAVAGVAVFINGGTGEKVAGIVLVLLGALCLYEFFAHKIADRISQKYSKRNIETKARFALNYCRQHPEAYDELVIVNQAFAQKYIRDETGRIVRRK